MIEIGKKRRGKYCAVVKRGKEKLFVCTDEPEKKEDIYYVAYLVEKGYKSGVVRIGKKLKVFVIEDERVYESEEEIPEDVEDLETYLSAKFTDTLPVVIYEDIESLRKRYTPFPKTYVAIAIGLALVVFLGGGVFYWKKKREEELRRLIEESRKPKLVRLTQKQKVKIQKAVSQRFIEELANFVNSLPELQRIKSVSLKFINVPPREGVPEKLYGEMNVVIESVYPLEGSRKSGKYFVKTFTKRIDVKDFRAFKDGENCVKEILNSGGELQATNPLTFVAVFKDTKEAFRFLETVYGCPFYFTQVHMGNTHSFKLVVK